MKKLLLTIGSVAAVIAPMATVVACGEEDPGPTPSTKVFLKAEDIIANPGRYLDVDGKQLIWDNIKEDGFNSLSIAKSENDAIGDGAFLEVEADWIINTDMNLPSWIEETGSTFHDSEFDKEIHISYDLMHKDTYHEDTAFEREWGFAFTDATINDGIVFEDTIKVIPFAFLAGSMISKNAQPDYKIKLPDSLEVIGEYAFDAIESDVIEYDFENLTNLYYIGNDAFHTSNGSHQQWLAGKIIVLPESFEVDANDDPEGGIFGWLREEYSPTLIQYYSVNNWNTASRSVVAEYEDQVNWSNIY